MVISLSHVDQISPWNVRSMFLVAPATIYEFVLSSANDMFPYYCLLFI